MNEQDLENVELSDFSLGDIFVNSKGDPGEKGEPGKDGKDGVPGKDGHDGLDGRDGQDGKDGKDGKQGIAGKDGKNGTDANIEIIKNFIKDEVELIKPKTEDIIAEIKEKKLIDISEIRNSNPYQIAKKKTGKLDMSDLRWHGGGINSTVITITASTYTDTSLTGFRKIIGNAVNNSITITLPDARNSEALFTIKKVDVSANTITVAAFGSQTIDGASTKVISIQYDSIDLFSDKSNWFIS